MGPTGQEREIIRRIFDFDEHGTTQMFDDVMENPVYFDTGFFITSSNIWVVPCSSKSKIRRMISRS